MPLQRNITDHPLDVPAVPITLQPGDEVDWDDPIVGCEPVPSPPAKKSAAKSATTPEG
ncbi:hypothetical protein ABIA32_002691 [Streptacidiphilus sp. MAP12-20]|uniref:hypothetical protein n=1 Tax=Streptacidiphilus sp. MAP12-20 TaxID=3156299 RepID=UPI003516DFA4